MLAKAIKSLEWCKIAVGSLDRAFSIPRFASIPWGQEWAPFPSSGVYIAGMHSQVVKALGGRPRRSRRRRRVVLRRAGGPWLKSGAHPVWVSWQLVWRVSQPLWVCARLKRDEQHRFRTRRRRCEQPVPLCPRMASSICVDAVKTNK